MNAWRGALVLGLVAATSCGPAAGPAATATTRDSVGIRIVENQAPVHPDAPWILDSLPIIDLGSQEFSGFVYPLRLSDGRVVVANGGTNELRFFGADGKSLKTVGRKGSGPGEFQQLGWLELGVGDTLRTYDWSLRRFSVFAGDGALQRLITLRSGSESSSPRPVGTLRDGRLIALSQSIVTTSSKPGAGRDTMPLQVYGADGVIRDSLGRWPGPEHLIETGPNTVSVSGLPFGKDLSVVVHEARLYVGTADGPEVVVLKSDGTPEQIVRWVAPPVPVVPADREAYLATLGEGWLPGQEAMRAQFFEMIKRAPFPKWKPAYAGLLVGSDGSIWVRGYTEPDKAAPTVFAVFDAAGRWLGAVRMPAQFTPTQIGAGFVTGTWKDADDVLQVRVYRLVSGPRT